ncbi:MAG: glycosyl hydrolase, partial [Chloroflexi bacterium]|nr:glycosyl hydrolase [Chloroflexota bacterium]
MRRILLLLALACAFAAASCSSQTGKPTASTSPALPSTEPAEAATLVAPPAGGSVAPYKDPSLSVDARVDDLLSRMTLPEKIGQMTQVEKNSIRPDDIRDMYLGSLLTGGDGSPSDPRPVGWANMVNGYQRYALETRLAIPMLYGIDAVHGHAHVYGAVIFPHNVGLGATHDPALVQQVGRATAEEMAATAIRWNFGPVVAVPQDIRWGRTYEGFGENTELVSALGSAYVKGLQSVGDYMDLAQPSSVLATPKHYIGDGGTTWGTSTRTMY